MAGCKTSTTSDDLSGLYAKSIVTGVALVPVSSRIPPAVGQLADPALWEAELATDPAVVKSELVSGLRQVPDRRAKHGRRHALVVILTLTACATLVIGGDSIAAIWQWAARAPPVPRRRG
ncbi:transposase family protein [Streptomyces sp. R28]|uniref:Transposase family protein n=1 Tax=Streptomyces sp. R28 TaxID=3238628 RepID=A0AB39QIG0_9ACTN